LHRIELSKKSFHQRKLKINLLKIGFNVERVQKGI
jgi:hypothetical protein